MYTRAPTYRNDICHCSTGIGFISSSSNGFSITISKCLHFETYLPYPSDGSDAHLQIQKNTKNKKQKQKKAGALFSNVNAEGKGGRIWLPLQKSNTSKIAFNPDLILEVEIW